MWNILEQLAMCFSISKQLYSLINTKIKKLSKKRFPQTAQISKQDNIFSKFPSQHEIGGEHWGTAHDYDMRRSSIVTL